MTLTVPAARSRAARLSRRSHPARRRAAAVVQSLESRVLLAADFRISEFQADNVATLPDEDGQYSDWIEIHNAGTTAGDLAGYRLTDNVARTPNWALPSVTVPAGGHLVVFASGKNRANPAGTLHTNFSLNADGEYLALLAPDGTVRTEFAPKFPDQEEDVSYGTDPAAVGGPLRYFATPTPGAANVRSEVVINEIHYDPDVKTQLVEFIELHNPGAAAVNLTGARFTDGITYAFPAGATLPAGGYLVLAQDAAQFQAKYFVAPFGQYTGALSNEGETVRLRNKSGGTLDSVDYKPGFPWPTVGDDPGYSIELINPDFENDVGGNWRGQPPGASGGTALFASGTNWSYLKGTAEASSPFTAWREPGFAETGWSTGPGPVGYDEGGVPMGTTLSDMRNNYTSVFLRKKFNVTNPAAVTSLRLEAMYDDGFNAWLNGTLVHSANVSPTAGFGATAGTALEDATYRPVTLASGALRRGENVLAVQFFNASKTNSSDAYFDARLIGTSTASPSPGRSNSVYSDNAAPQMRQVNHSPQQPVGGQPVTVTAKITDPDGVAAATLRYQVVRPGNYVAITDPAYQTDWTNVTMRDDGTNGDALAGDGVFSAQVPAAANAHRNLVRYRITASDSRGASITAPYADDSVPNFAYFVYNGVPSWTGAARPGASPAVTYDQALMREMPAYHLISKNQDVEDATWNDRYRGDNYLWEGALVHNGVVYDHIRYRARGGVWRYAMVKNMWKFDFNHNHGFQAHDDYGNPYPVKWDKLNLSAIIQQANFGHRGEQGLFESVGMALFNLAGVAAPVTNFVQFRVVDDAAEYVDQYNGDLWGMYLAVEQPDGNFLDMHGLPDGNLYKMESGTGELNNQGPTQPTDKSDLEAFQAGYQNPAQTDQWFRANLNLESYYSYRAILEAIHHYDIGAGKNYFFYHNPVTDKWETTVWDLDLTWSNNMYGDGNEPLRAAVLPRPAFSLEYRNRVRELRDLLFNPDQTGALIDEMAAKVYTAGRPSWVDVDRAVWDWNPKMASTSGYSTAPDKAGQGRYYAGGNGVTIPAPGGFEGMMNKMKAYASAQAGQRGAHLDGLAADGAIPYKPVVTYTGPAAFPGDRLTFRTSAFNDPQGAGTFGAMQWRIAEVTNPNAPDYDPRAPKKYEINAVWESGELTTFSPDVSIPGQYVQQGKTYRVRVRMKDNSGRWSNWSDAAQFTAGLPDQTVKDALRITEIGYHPASDPAGTFAGQQYEFIELQNTSAATINLRDVRFVNGIDYAFGDVTLGGGQYIVVARNRDAFAQRYGTAGINLAPGNFTKELNDDGDRIELVDAANQTVHDFTYDDAWHPTTDGEGPTLVVASTTQPLAAWGTAGGWRPSSAVNGSPGRGDVADTTRPTADVIDVTPDPRGTAVDSIRIVFSEPVTGFDLGDLLLYRLNGDRQNLLTAAQSLTTSDNVTWTLGNLAGLTGPLGGGYRLILNGPDNPAQGVTDAAGNALTGVAFDDWNVGAVFGRYVFYNNSSFDGRDPGANAGDDAAVAADKAALLPGATGTFANVTSYSRGINGVIVDVTPLSPGGGVTASAFDFKVGTGGDPAAWPAAPAPASVTLRRGAGAGGSDRITITWPDGAIKNTWLRVAVKPGFTPLPAPDVFYFGNLVGETGDAATPRRVTAVDLAAVRTRLNRAAAAGDRHDFNRDRRIDVRDLVAVRAGFFRSIPLLTVPTAPAAAAAGSFGDTLIAPATTTARLPTRRAWLEEPAELLG